MGNGIIRRLRERVRQLGSLQLSDPGLANAFSSDRVAPAPPAAGPQRLTFYVPHHDTRLSLGQGNDTYRTDTGIVGYTQELISWDVEVATKTSEAMGATVALPHLDRNSVPSAATGYALTTEGRAYHEAEKQHYITSLGGDVICNTASGKPALMQSDAGVVEINAGDCVTIRGANCVQFATTAFTPQTPGYDVPFTLAEAEKSTGLTQQDLHSWADRAANGLELLLGLVRPLHEPNEMEPGPGRGEINWPPFVVTATKTAVSFWSPDEQCVNLDADGNVSIAGGVVAALHGVLGASVTGSLGAAMTGLSAGLKAFAYAGAFGGIECAFNAMKTVKLTSQSGGVGISSAKGTSIVGQSSLQLTAGTDAQMDGAKACLSGQHAFVGAGSSFGLYGTSQGMMMRKVDDAKKFSDPGESPKLFAGINRADIEIQAKEGVRLQLAAMDCRLEVSGKTLKLGTLGIEGHTPKLELET